ncbi:MAG TPA: SMI1/KNR4 family protein [Gemmatimonadales bacterium]|nr:SMI1/KNR4 family protein [Gemmatimonadales bacterium]
MSFQLILRDLTDAWTVMGFARARPADEPQINEFETKYHVRLPPDFRAYVASLNGGESGRDGPMDSSQIAFWRLDQIEPLVKESSDGPPVLFVFADFLIDSHAYAIQLSDDPNTPTPVFIDWGERTEKVADSFSSFIHSYLSNDRHVLFGADESAA